MVQPDDVPDVTTPGGRVKAIRKELGLSGGAFVGRLNDAAEQAGFGRYWTWPKVTNAENNKRGISPDDAIVIAHLDPERRGWLWIMYGVPDHKGEDAWATLAKAAKRKRA